MNSDVLCLKHFSNLQEILEWDDSRRPEDQYCRSSVALQKNYTLFTEDAAEQLNQEENKSRNQSLRPKLMVCHDYGAGLKEDTYYQGYYGGNNKRIFCLMDWDLVDYFVYFTHARLTIPPPGWTNVAHKHGAKSLGVFIVEGEEEGLTDCLQMLTQSETHSKLIQKMTEIALFFGFDGYLLNIEVNLKDHEKVDSLITSLLLFVDDLKSSMQSVLPESLVIWYDSITVKSDVSCCGDLHWQDSLTSANAPFFDRSYGILLNYFWKEETLEEDVRASQSYLQPRQFDVFKGVDIFARGTPAYKDGLQCLRAIEKITNVQLSCGLYAPGYFYEKCPSENAPEEYSNMFWNKLRNIWKSRNVLAEFPLSTNFCNGQGKHMFWQGLNIQSKPWFNISLQDVRPSYDYEREDNFAFNGGSCLKLSLKNQSALLETFPLFDLHIDVYDEMELLVSIVASTDFPVGIYLTIAHQDKNERTLELKNFCIVTQQSDTLAQQLKKFLSQDIQLVNFEVQQIPNISTKLEAMHESESSSLWHRFSKIIKLDNIKEGSYLCQVGMIGMSLNDVKTSFTAFMGQLLISSSNRLNLGCLSDVSIDGNTFSLTIKSEIDKNFYSINCQLKWKGPASQYFIFYEDLKNSASSLLFIGCTTCQYGFLIKDLLINISNLKLKLYVCFLDIDGKYSQFVTTEKTLNQSNASKSKS